MVHDEQKKGKKVRNKGKGKKEKESASNKKEKHKANMAARFGERL